jgi:hypothetical protein
MYRLLMTVLELGGTGLLDNSIREQGAEGNIGAKARGSKDRQTKQNNSEIQLSGN